MWSSLMTAYDSLCSHSPSYIHCSACAVGLDSALQWGSAGRMLDVGWAMLIQSGSAQLDKSLLANRWEKKISIFFFLQGETLHRRLSLPPQLGRQLISALKTALTPWNQQTCSVNWARSGLFSLQYETLIKAFPFELGTQGLGCLPALDTVSISWKTKRQTFPGKQAQPSDLREGCWLAGKQKTLPLS